MCCENYIASITIHIIFLQVNGKYIIKSGTDFRHFSKITLNFDKASVDVNVEEIAVTSAFQEDPVLRQILEKYASKTEKCDQYIPTKASGYMARN
jgi:2',3'-cyclic-nucleotide 2'-phosphodiesterase (5'-nucleotidase family)